MYFWSARDDFPLELEAAHESAGVTAAYGVSDGADVADGCA